MCVIGVRIVEVSILPSATEALLHRDIGVIPYWHSAISKSHAICCTRTVRDGATAARFARRGRAAQHVSKRQWSRYSHAVARE